MNSENINLTKYSINLMVFLICKSCYVWLYSSFFILSNGMFQLLTSSTAIFSSFKQCSHCGTNPSQVVFNCLHQVKNCRKIGFFKKENIFCVLNALAQSDNCHSVNQPLSSVHTVAQILLNWCLRQVKNCSKKWSLNIENIFCVFNALAQSKKCHSEKPALTASV